MSENLNGIDIFSNKIILYKIKVFSVLEGIFEFFSIMVIDIFNNFRMFLMNKEFIMIVNSIIKYQRDRQLKIMKKFIIQNYMYFICVENGLIVFNLYIYYVLGYQNNLRVLYSLCKIFVSLVKKIIRYIF